MMSIVSLWFIFMFTDLGLGINPYRVPLVHPLGLIRILEFVLKIFAAVNKLPIKTIKPMLTNESLFDWF